MKAIPTWLKRLAWILTAFAAVLVGTVIVALVALDSAPGRALLKGAVVSAVSSPGRTLIIDGIEGDPLGSMTLVGLRLADGDGDWLVAERIETVFNPWALLRARFDVKRITISRVSVIRLPRGGQADDRAAGPFSFPSVPIAVAVDQFSIETLTLGADLAGRPSRFAVEASARLDWGAARLEVHAAPISDGAALDLTAHLDFNARLLDARLEYKEPRGGPVARLAGLNTAAPLTLSLIGDGAPSNWRGELVVREGEIERLGTDIALGIDPGGRISVAAQGGFSVDSHLFPAAARIGALDAGVDLESSFAQGQMTIDRLALTARESSVTLSGTYRPANERLDIVAELRVARTAAWLGADFPVAARNLVSRATVVGAISRPRIDSRVSLGAMEGIGWSVRDLEASFLAEPATGGIIVDFESTAKTAPKAPGMPLVEMEAILSAFVSDDLSAADIAQFELDAGTARLTGNGRLDWQGGQSRLDVAVAVGDLTKWPGLDAQLSAGRASARISGVFGVAPVTIYAASFNGTATDLIWRDQAAAALAGSRLRLSADVAGDETSGWRIRNLTMATAAIGLGAAIDVTGDFSEMGARYALRFDRLDALSEVAGMQLVGGAAATGQVGWSAAGLAGRTEARLSDLRIDNVEVGRVDLAGDIVQNATGVAGKIEVTAPDLPAPVTASAKYDRSSAGYLTLSQIDVRQDAMAIAGALVIDPRSGLLDGTLEMRSGDLSVWAAAVDTELAGRFDGTLALSPREGRQGIVAKATGTNLVVAGEPIDRVTLSLDGTPEMATLTMAVARQAAPAVEITAEAQFESVEQEIRLALVRFGGTLGGDPVTLARTARLLIGPDGVTLTDFDITAGGGGLSAALSIGDRLDGTMTARSIDLSRLSALIPGISVPGVVTAQITLTGSRSAPRADLIADLMLPPEDELPPARVDARATWDGRHIDGRATIGGILDHDLTATATIPMRYDAATGVLDLPMNEPIAGSLIGVGRLSPLADWAPSGLAGLDGMLESDLRIFGSLDRPQVGGRVALTGLRMDHVPSGAGLRDGRFVVEAQGATVLTIGFEASGAGGGRISGSGQVRLTARAPSLQLAARLDAFRIAGRDDLDATVGGQLTGIYDDTGSAVTGKLVVDRADIRVSDFMSSGVVVIDYEHVNCPECEKAEKTAPVTTMPPIRLGLEIELPNRIFVRAPNFESEWQGLLKIEGTAEAPIVTGTLQTIAGRVDVIGKRFEIDRGRLVFSGGQPPDPSIDVRAVTETDDLKAAIVVAGTASQPDIALSSEPPLAEDEILARVLFGASGSELSTAQVLQLADAAATLSGKGGGLGLVDRVRRGLGVDVLDVEPTGQVSVGKYIADDVFLRYRQGLAGSGNVVVEYEITPSISVESDMGSEGESRFGVNWEFDY